MSRNQRIGLLLAALAVAVVAVVVAVASGGGDDEGSQAAQTTQETTDTGPATGTATGTDTETDEQPHETVPAKPAVTRIRIEGGKVVGGLADIKAKKGDTVRIAVSSDAPDEFHLHGYDIYERAEPGQPARFLFKANIEGIFELESHVAEDAGRDPLVGKLTVEPS
jgi:FtsP/CotA-like multicopper oxidase with cupredoxin domain